MLEIERIKLTELLTRAVSVNERLLAGEKKFINELASSSDIESLKEMNLELNELCIREHLLLAASKSLLQIMTKQL